MFFSSLSNCQIFNGLEIIPSLPQPDLCKALNSLAHLPAKIFTLAQVAIVSIANRATGMRLSQGEWCRSLRPAQQIALVSSLMEVPSDSRKVVLEFVETLMKGCAFSKEVPAMIRVLAGFPVEKGKIVFNATELWVIAALHKAAAAGQTGTVAFLLEKGAAIEGANILPREKRFFFELMPRKKNQDLKKVKLKELKRILQEEGTPLHAAVRAGQQEMAAFLLEQRAEMAATNGRGDTPLHAAVRAGQQEMAAFLLERGAQIEDENDRRDTSLHAAVQAEQTGMVAFLLAKGAKTDVKNYRLETPLYNAVEIQSSAIVKLLLAKGAAVDDGDCYRSPLEAAFSFDTKTAVCRILLQHGATITRDNFYQLIACGERCSESSALLEAIKWVIRHLQIQIPDNEIFQKLLAYDVLDKSRILSHWLNISGTTQLQNNYSARLEIGSDNDSFVELFTDLFEDFTQCDDFKGLKISTIKIESLRNALKKILSQSFYAEIVKNINNRELVFFPIGWQGHAICLVFYGDYLAICNRGDGTENHGTIEVFKIDPTLMTSEIFQEILQFEDEEAEEGIQFFYHDLPAKLSSTKQPEQDVFCKSFQQILPKPQKIGNCPLSCLKAALRFAWVVLDAPSERDLQTARLEIKIFTDWAATEVFHQNIAFIEDLRILELARASKDKKSARYQQNIHPERGNLAL